MKKILAIVLAGVLTLGMSVSVLADANLDGSTPSAGADVNAKIVPDISATVTWGAMNFTYTESTHVWAANNTNGVTVTNNTSGRSIDTSYSYEKYDEKGEATMTAGWVESDEMYYNPGNYNAYDGEYAAYNFTTPTTCALNNLGTTLAPNAVQKFWLTFTTEDSVSTLTTDFAKVGTLTITIAAH